jgi:hypothetical protein
MIESEEDEYRRSRRSVLWLVSACLVINVAAVVSQIQQERYFNAVIQLTPVFLALWSLRLVARLNRARARNKDR